MDQPNNDKTEANHSQMGPNKGQTGSSKEKEDGEEVIGERVVQKQCHVPERGSRVSVTR